MMRIIIVALACTVALSAPITDDGPDPIGAAPAPLRFAPQPGWSEWMDTIQSTPPPDEAPQQQPGACTVEDKNRCYGICVERYERPGVAVTEAGCSYGADGNVYCHCYRRRVWSVHVRLDGAGQHGFRS